MSSLASESDRGSTDSSEGALTVRELAARLEVPLAWRPWPRARLSARELGALERALADAHCELVGRQVLPRSLRARVQVAQAQAAQGRRVARAGRRVWRVTVKLTGFAVGLTAFVAAVIGIVAALATRSARPSPLGGNLSVIVLPLAAASSEQPAVTALAHTVATTLRAQLPQVDPLVLSDVRWDPAHVPTSIAAQARFASALAASEGADAVMFGQVGGGELALIAPYVYVSPRRLRQASELAGVYRLGPPIRLPVQIGESTAADGLARAQLAARARGLAEFVDAMGYYAVGRYTQAIAHLRAAAASPSWTTPQGQAMIDLFLGNATGKLASTHAALAATAGFYRAALAHNPALERARFGLAEVGFQVAHGDCTARTVKRGQMASALAGYHTVLTADSPSPASTPGIELSAKARFGIARVLLCLSQAGLAADWSRAENELRLVIAAYPHARFLRSEAGEAWGDLALAELPARGAKVTRSAYLAAQQSYTRALELTLDPTARAALYANRAFVEQHLGESSAAAGDYLRAARAEGDTALGRQWMKLSH
jgi:tetratricopeptide (TPR) repeat protein